MGDITLDEPLALVDVADGRCRAILVDDTERLRAILRRFLEVDDGRYVVVGEAGDGQRGVELAGQLQPDLVLLDMSMPVMDGLTALPLIQECSPGSRVVVFTGFEHDNLRERILAHGGVTILHKGVSRDDLLGAVATAVFG